MTVAIPLKRTGQRLSKYRVIMQSERYYVT